MVLLFPPLRPGSAQLRVHDRLFTPAAAVPLKPKDLQPWACLMLNVIQPGRGTGERKAPALTIDRKILDKRTTAPSTVTLMSITQCKLPVLLTAERFHVLRVD